MLTELRSRVNELLAKKREVSAIALRERQAKREARINARLRVKAQAIAQQVAQNVQQSIHNQLSSVVTRCLETVFPEQIEFRILFEKIRGRTQARPIFIENDNEIDPKTAAGGAVKHVAAQALRIACLKLSKPPKRSFLALDEPFLSVCEDYQDLIASLIATMSKELGIQIVIVTHNKAYRLGKVVEIG